MFNENLKTLMFNGNKKHWFSMKIKKRLLPRKIKNINVQ